MPRFRLIPLSAILLVVACEPASDVELQPLPSLQRPSAAARVGLPEVEGRWVFAGWELASGDSASLEGALPSFGPIAVQRQQLDSLSGYYGAAGGQAPLTGEVRRDGVVAAVVGEGAEARYLAGHLRRDTLWLRLASLPAAQQWPRGARAAFVRGAQVASPFVRLEGQPVLAAADSVVAPRDSALAAPGAAEPPTGSPALGDPQPERAAESDLEQEAEAEAEVEAAGGAQVESEAQTELEVEPELAPRRETPRLLGEPVRLPTQADTARDTTALRVRLPHPGR